MTQAARYSDKVFRYGGEEFTILLPHTSKDQAYSLAERLRNTVEKHKFILPDTGKASHITISIGISAFPDDAVSAQSLLKKADDALYKAKKNRNKVARYSD